MQIGTICDSCGKTQEFPASFAGKTALCKFCRSGVEVPALPAESVAYGAEGALSYQSPQTGSRTISRERRLAGRSCVGLGALFLVFATFVGLGFLFAFGRLVKSGPLGAIVVVVGAELILMGSAVTYIVCGIGIRRGGRVPAIVALVLVFLQEFAALLFLLASFSVVAGGATGLIPVGVSLLAVAAFGQLIYYLIQILREPSGYMQA